MPAKVFESPLEIDFAFPDGSTWSADLSRLPNQQLASDLARGLATLVHPHGTIGTRSTAADYLAALRTFVTTLSTDGFKGGAAELTAARCRAFWMSRPHHHERRIRLILRGFDATIHHLKPDLQAHVYGRTIRPKPKSTPYQSYTRAEWERLTTCCTDIIDSAWRRHQDMLAIAKQGRSPRASKVAEKSLAWMMLRHGPMNHYQAQRFIGQGLGPSADGVNYYRRWIRSVREALFPTLDVQIAYRLLMGIYSGIVPDGVDDLGLGDIDWAGDSTILLSYVKGRTAGEGATLPRQAVTILRQWLDHSEPLRRTAIERYRESLWLAINPIHQSARVIDANYTGGTLAKFSRRHGLVDDSGQPLQVHRGRIRATYHGLLASRGWSGRTTIDPNHSAAVEGDHYLTAATPEQMNTLEEVIENGQNDLVRKALPATVLMGDMAAQVAAELPARIAELTSDAPEMAELVGGQHDVFVAACADQLAGLWGRKGQPCPARPWVCLMCPLAVFLPRHAPNLLRLKAFFARQFRQMPTSQFMQVFGPYADRLDSQILPQFSTAVLASAANVVADSDIEIPLRPEESTR